MGQYYTATLTRNNKTRCFFPLEFDSGSKLTEHSWIGNNFVGTVASKIYNRKGRLAWVGDYASGVVDKVTSADGTSCQFTPDELYSGGRDYQDSKGNWHTQKLMGLSKAPVVFTEFDYTDKYFINLTRKEYIDMNEFIARSSMTDESWLGWCQNPVSLMTAVGNNQGGGDYYDNLIGFEYVGTWAFDEVVIKDKEPKGFTKLNVTFNEHIENTIVRQMN